MLSYFKKRANKRRDEEDLAALRTILAKINELISFQDARNDNLLFVALVGRQLRILLEHRFGSAVETSVHSDKDLRNEELLVDALSLDKLHDLSQGLDARGMRSDDPRKTTALFLLSGWLKTKLICKRSRDQAMIDKAREHEDIYMSHIRNMLRASRGEQLITE